MRLEPLKRIQELDRTGTGIDLVGFLHGGGLAAIQCKLFGADRRIRKEDIDTFWMGCIVRTN